MPQVLAGKTSEIPHWLTKLILAQGVSESAAYQLPDPLLGAGGSNEGLVIGLNPGFDPTAILPTLDWSVETYIKFYCQRFRSAHRNAEGQPIDLRSNPSRERVIPHYRRVEQALALRFGERAIGCSVVYADALPWRSRGSALREILTIQGAIDAAQSRVELIVSELQPRLVITLGCFAGSLLGLAPGANPIVVDATISDWNGRAIALYHPSAWALGRDYWDRARNTLTSS